MMKRIKCVILALVVVDCFDLIPKRGEDYFYMLDELGSGMYLKGTDGASVSTYAYDEFGRNIDPFTGKKQKPSYTKQGNMIQPLAFTGYQNDEMTDNYFAQARYYNAEAGRFVSEDKIRGFIDSPETINHYLYCWDNPTKLIDLDGNAPILVTTPIITGPNVYNDYIEGYDDALQRYDEEKPDSFETPERKKYFKEHREELIEKYDNIYHILDNGEPEEQLKHIDEVLWDNRVADETPEKIEEINDLWLGMAAILTEIIIRFQGSGTINCNTYRVTLSLNDSLFDIEPIDIVVQSWLQYHCDNDKSMLMVWAQARTVVMYKV